MLPANQLPPRPGRTGSLRRRFSISSATPISSSIAGTTACSGTALDGDIAHWKTLDDTLAGPHSIASDGEVYVVEDTGRNGLRVYRRAGDGFKRTQDIRNITQRPHRVRYDAETKSFYVVTANSQDIYQLVRDGDGLKLAGKKHLDFLGAITRGRSPLPTARCTSFPVPATFIRRNIATAAIRCWRDRCTRGYGRHERSFPHRGRLVVSNRVVPESGPRA